MRELLRGRRTLALLALEAVTLMRCSSRAGDRSRGALDGGASASSAADATSTADSSDDSGSRDASTGSSDDSGWADEDVTTGLTSGEAGSSYGGHDAGVTLDATIASTADATTDGDAESSARDATTNDGDAGRAYDAAADAPSDARAGDEDASDGATSLGVDCSTDAGGSISSTGAPLDLACTGLYSSWSSRTLATGVVPYAPGVPLWADGATKSRYVLLPTGTQIDTSNMDEWTFPIGTKIWKEFTLNGAKVETRFLYKASSSGWIWTTYQWSADQQTATELTTGATNVNGTSYEIPDHDRCDTCHQGRIDFVLGFEAIGLSMPAATGLTMSALVAQGRLTAPPASPLTIPGDAKTSAALGWLHANCGNACHNPSPDSLAGVTGFYMRLSASGLSSVETTNTYVTGVNVESRFVEPDGGEPLLRIAAGNPSASCVVYRDGHRDAYTGQGVQMPPIDSHVVDTADVQVVSIWIASLDAGTD